MSIMILNSPLKYCRVAALLLLPVLFLTSCATSKKIDRFVASQYGNQLPRISKSHSDNNISVTSSVASGFNLLSSTQASTDHFLPLLFYWQYNHKFVCTLNPGIFVNKFTNTMKGEAQRRLGSKLGERKLALTITQLPHAFTLGEKYRSVWVILYLFQWDKTYLSPDTGSLKVDYELLQENKVVKSGTILVPNGQKEKGLGMFQSWKNATSSQIAAYNYEIVKMSRSCIDQLMKEL